jgi:hypothetical protein
VRDYSLNLFTSVLEGQEAVGNITETVERWSRSKRFNGWSWEGSFRLTGDEGELLEFMHTRLGYHLEEQVGGETTWEGLIYEMDMHHAGVVRRRSLPLLWNYLLVDYISDADTTVTTSVTQDLNSLAKYGRKEEVLTLDGVTAAMAQAYADTYLKENAWPWARPVAVSNATAPRLDVIVVGYVHTANWRYASIVDETTTNLNVWIKDIVDADFEFLSTGFIATNALQVVRKINMRRRGWDKLEELRALGDTNGDLYQLSVSAGRRVNYGKVGTEPRYLLSGGRIMDLSGAAIELSPYLVEPNVVRDQGWPIRSQEKGSFFDDSRDMLIDEIKVDRNGRLSLRTPLFTEAEILAEQIWLEQQHQRWEAQEA